MAVNDPLVSTDWLAGRLGDPDVVVVDGSWHMPAEGRDAAAEHRQTRIPGAVRFDIDAICDQASGLPHMLPSPAEFARSARRLGVSEMSTVVVYDSLGLFSAARVWWTFRAMGHDRTFVLDGGLPKWIGEGRPVETGEASPEVGDFQAERRADLVEDLEGMRAAVAAGRPQIIDARAADRFSGAAPEPRAGLRSGHMPGARNLPWSRLVTPDGRLADSEALRDTFADADVNLSAPIITTCGSGVSAAILALALARLGRPDVAVYDGSWSEWGALSDTPIATGEA